MAGNFALNNLNMDLGLDVDERRLPTKNFMLISGVVLILLLTFIFWIITPTIKGIFTTRTELEQANEKLADYASKLDRIRALATSSDYQYSDLVDKILPENNPFMELQYSLNQLALEHNLTFTRFEYSPGLVATPSADFASSNRDAMSVAARYAQEMDNEGFTMFIEAQGPYNDLVAFLKKLENFLMAAGKRYAGNPNIAFIDVGTFGLWGEGHTGASSHLSQEDTVRITKIHIDLHVKAFPGTLLCISDDVDGAENQTGNYPATDYARSKGVSLRDDSIMVQNPPRSWFHADMADRFWRELPVIVEHEHYGSSKARGAWDSDLLEKSVEDYHASFMSIHWRPQQEWDECKDAIRRINLRLGYRIQLREMELPKTAEIGKPFSVKSVWANAGVAPCYPGGFMTLTFKDEKGGIVAALSDETLDFRTLKVGPKDAIPVTTHESIFTAGRFAPTTKPGVYDVYVSVGQRDGTPVLALPLPNNDGQRRYKIGQIELK